MASEIDVSTRKYPNTKTIVDDEDYERLIDTCQWIVTCTARGKLYVKEGGKRGRAVMHRLVMQAEGDEQIIHINGNTLDNRKENLQAVKKGAKVANRKLEPDIEVALLSKHNLRTDFSVRVIDISTPKYPECYAFVDAEDFDRLMSGPKWHVSKARRGYLCAARIITSDGRRRISKLHREVMESSQGKLIDHINRNAFDNRKENLRFCSFAENIRNTAVRKNNRSGFKGVGWREKEQAWRARIYINKKNVTLGYFKDVIDAAKAYDAAAIKHHGEFSVTNKSLGLY